MGWISRRIFFIAHVWSEFHSGCFFGQVNCQLQCFGSGVWFCPTTVYVQGRNQSPKRLVDFLRIFDSFAKESTEARKPWKSPTFYIMIRLLGENSLNLSGFRQCKKPFWMPTNGFRNFDFQLCHHVHLSVMSVCCLLERWFLLCQRETCMLISLRDMYN